MAPGRHRGSVVALILLVASAVLVPATAAAGAPPPAPSGPRGPDHTSRFRDGRVLVAFQPGVTPEDQLRAEHAAHAREVRGVGVGARVLEVPSGTVPNTVRLLSSYPGVRYAEPDYLAHPAATPNDPSFSNQWADQNTGQTVNGVTGVAGADEHITSAWNTTTGSRSIVIGEVDTGVDYTHPDLAANIWTNPGGIGGCAAGTHGYNTQTGACDPKDDDTTYGGHGTHVAGILGAVGNNGSGVTGVNWSTTILPVKWLDASGSGSTSDLIAGLDWLLQARAAGVNVRVVNDSDVFFGTAYSQALSDEIDLLGQNSILFVTAGGNTSDNNDNPAVRRYPCGYERPNEICAMASNQSDARPSWANYGPSTVDIAAPGDNIYSTLRGGTYGYISGSSMASPQVAGAAALVLSHQDMSATQLKADLLEGADPIPSLAGVVRTGGRLDVCNAMPGCATSGPSAGTLGLTSVGANSDQMLADRKRVNHYQLGVAGTVTKLSAYLAPTGTSGQQSLEGVIYADQAGVPGALVATSTPITFSSTSAAGWFDLTFAVPVALPAGTYWIGVISGTTSNVIGFRWNSVAGARAYNANTYTSGPSNPFGAATVDGEQMSIYATYTASGSGSTPAPFDVTPPTISAAQSQPGHPSPEPQQNVALTASPGTWDHNPTSYAYQWLRCDMNGSSCTPISGATGTTYTPTVGDVGSTLQVAVTATNTTGSTSAASEPTMVVQAAASPNTFGKTAVGGTVDPAPANWERADVFAMPQPGSVTKLTVYLDRLAGGAQALQGVLYADQGGSPGALLAASGVVTFASGAPSGWYDLPFAAPVALPAGSYWLGVLTGDTGQVFGLRYDDSTAASSAVVPASFAAGPLNPFGAIRFDAEQISIYATYTSSQPSPPPVNTTLPTIVGTAQQGQTLTASAGTWTNSPTGFTYQWDRCPVSGSCAPIGGATSTTYSLTSLDVGSTIKVAVTATNAGGAATATSLSTPTVVALPSGGTFGLTSVGANGDQMVANRKRVNHYQLGVAGTVTKLSAYLAPTGTSGQQSLEGVIYADQSGMPGALLATSTQITFSSTSAAGWLDLVFATPVALPAGTYWIGVVSGSTSNVIGFRWNSVAGARAYNTNTYTSGPSNPFGTAHVDAEQMSIYATYQ